MEEAIALALQLTPLVLQLVTAIEAEAAKNAVSPELLQQAAAARQAAMQTAIALDKLQGK